MTIAASKSIGGKARAASLSPERRREIAKKAAEARWTLNFDKPNVQKFFEAFSNLSTQDLKFIRTQIKILTKQNR